MRSEERLWKVTFDLFLVDSLVDIESTGKSDDGNGSECPHVGRVVVDLLGFNWSFYCIFNNFLSFFNFSLSIGNFAFKKGSKLSRKVRCFFLWVWNCFFCIWNGFINFIFSIVFGSINEFPSVFELRKRVRILEKFDGLIWWNFALREKNSCARSSTLKSRVERFLS